MQATMFGGLGTLPPGASPIALLNRYEAGYIRQEPPSDAEFFTAEILPPENMLGLSFYRADGSPASVDQGFWVPREAPADSTSTSPVAKTASALTSAASKITSKISRAFTGTKTPTMPTPTPGAPVPAPLPVPEAETVPGWVAPVAIVGVVLAAAGGLYYVASRQRRAPRVAANRRRRRRTSRTSRARRRRRSR
jgi:hypothetical protein